MSNDIGSRVVGYVAYKPGRGMFCVGEDHACLVTRSADALRRRAEDKNALVIKAHFGEIISAIELGGLYAFDQPAYRRFYSLVQRAKIPWNLSHPDTMRLDLMHVGILNRIPA